MNYTKKHESSLKGIARYLTNGMTEDLIKQYKAGKAVIRTEKGHALTPNDVRFIASYLKLGGL
jgi:hypothetical protein